MVRTLKIRNTLAAQHRPIMLLGAGMLIASMLSGCKADFGADVTNQTPQPLFAQIMLKGNDGASATLGASRRLGPGDRAFIGPVRTDAKAGAYLALDTLPNPGRPVTHDLAPGTSFLVISQSDPSNAGSLIIREK